MLTKQNVVKETVIHMESSDKLGLVIIKKYIYTKNI